MGGPGTSSNTNRTDHNALDKKGIFVLLWSFVIYIPSTPVWSKISIPASSLLSTQSFCVIMSSAVTHSTPSPLPSLVLSHLPHRSRRTASHMGVPLPCCWIRPRSGHSESTVGDQWSPSSPRWHQSPPPRCSLAPWPLHLGGGGGPWNRFWSRRSETPKELFKMSDIQHTFYT